MRQISWKQERGQSIYINTREESKKMQKAIKIIKWEKKLKKAKKRQEKE